tara:strand:- start:176 stop:424 length:249 start_codon:yes stop_codon:yes gene_type:complete
MSAPPVVRDEFDQSSGFDDLDDWSPDSAAESALRAGSRVFHPSFGEGVVLQIDGSDLDAKATVRFATGLQKRIISRFLTRAG